MEELSRSNPDVHKFFSNGNFVTRRSNRYWSGLPDDLIIEQVKRKLKFIYSTASQTTSCNMSNSFQFIFELEPEIICQKIQFFILFYLFSDEKNDKKNNWIEPIFVNWFAKNFTKKFDVRINSLGIFCEIIHKNMLCNGTTFTNNKRSRNVSKMFS